MFEPFLNQLVIAQLSKYERNYNLYFECDVFTQRKN